MGSWLAGLSRLIGLMLLAGAAMAQIGTKAYAIETVSGRLGMPEQVRVCDVGNGLELRGQVRKSAADPSRRMYGSVAVEYVDASGRVLGETHTRVQRTSPAKHSYTARFSVALDDVPAATRALRVSYR